MKLNSRAMFLCLSVLTLALTVINIFFGAVDLPASEVVEAFAGGENDSIVRYIVMENRIPQTFTSMLGGAALAVCGLMLQTAFRNPLAGPSILGISSGASLGVALVMLAMGGSVAVAGSLIAGYSAIIAGAVAGAMIITGILTAISLRVHNNLLLLLVGIMTGYLTSSVVTLLSSLSSAESLQNYVMWGTGSFANVSLRQLPWFAGLVMCGLLAAILMAKPLNILLLGDSYARNLGVRVERVKTGLLVVTGLLTAVTTAFCGPVSFIGLAMPHVARLLFRTDNHWILIPASMITGAILAMTCNVLSVMPLNRVIPINALTPIAGVPVILYVVLSRQR